MSSVEKAFVIIISLTMMLTIVNYIYLSQESQLETLLTAYGSNQESIGANVTSDFEDTTPDTSTVVYEETYGNTKSGGKFIWKAFSQSISGWQPLSDAEEPIERYVILGWNVVMQILHLLVLLLGLLIILNKKSD